MPYHFFTAAMAFYKAGTNELWIGSGTNTFPGKEGFPNNVLMSGVNEYMVVPQSDGGYVLQYCGLELFGGYDTNNDFLPVMTQWNTQCTSPSISTSASTYMIGTVADHEGFSPSIKWIQAGPLTGSGGYLGSPPSGVPEFSDIAWVLAAVLGAGSFVLIRKFKKGF